MYDQIKFACNSSDLAQAVQTREEARGTMRNTKSPCTTQVLSELTVAYNDVDKRHVPWH